ncbi:hypothetical protein F0562_035934 [Nyssa sinensis]|uniref:Dof zinc finger protein n=1 Tax=Nyssa sinensis TaxID=561372 RepID=A0A5J5AEC3_9ASTE|nr:hypothetical protein F0562_035934 [Nyssa sinensis]
MASESGDGRPARHQNMGTRPPEPENLPCPRCDSTNTKFCYYNNYNFSQPRHFCKSCRRYWTRGGTLRNVPVGGGTRKSSYKRSRTTSTSSSSSSSSTVTYDPILANPVTMMPEIKPEIASPLCGDLNLNESSPGSFTSLLNAQGSGFLALGGFGLGCESGFHDVGYGLGTGVWPMEEEGEGNVGGVGGGCGGGEGSFPGTASGCNTWQIAGVEGGLDDGECFDGMKFVYEIYVDGFTSM